MPRAYTSYGTVQRATLKAISRGTATPLAPIIPERNGRTQIPHSWRLEVAGDCLTPRIVLRDGVQLTKNGNHIFGRGLERPMFTETVAQCRDCENCLRRRKLSWGRRAVTEYERSVRTWFGTLTLRPDQHTRVGLEARSAASKAGDCFEEFTPEQRFLERHRIIGREITRYVKRLRETSGADLRLLCVTEAHKSGLPHYHMLVHEVTPGKQITHRTLKEQWRWGFSDYELVRSPKAAWYAAKYLGKSRMARVRASIDYGKDTTSDIETSKVSCPNGTLPTGTD